MYVNRENMALWISALRSGRFKQGRGALKVVQDGVAEHCCLGVLCELAVEAGVKVDVKGPFGPEGYVLFDESSGTLPNSVRLWAGLGSVDPLLVTSGVTSTCVQANDRFRAGFEQIADGLERYYGLLEKEADVQGQ